MQMEGGKGRGKRNIHHLPPPPSPGKKVCQGCFLPSSGWICRCPLSPPPPFLPSRGLKLDYSTSDVSRRKGGEGDSFHSRLSPLFLLLFALGEKNKKRLRLCRRENSSSVAEMLREKENKKLFSPLLPLPSAKSEMLLLLPKDCFSRNIFSGGLSSSFFFLSEKAVRTEEAIHVFHVSKPPPLLLSRVSFSSFALAGWPAFGWIQSLPCSPPSLCQLSIRAVRLLGSLTWKENGERGRYFRAIVEGKNHEKATFFEEPRGPPLSVLSLRVTQNAFVLLLLLFLRTFSPH